MGDRESRPQRHGGSVAGVIERRPFVTVFLAGVVAAMVAAWPAPGLAQQCGRAVRVHRGNASDATQMVADAFHVNVLVADPSRTRFDLSLPGCSVEADLTSIASASGLALHRTRGVYWLAPPQIASVPRGWPAETPSHRRIDVAFREASAAGIPRLLGEVGGFSIDGVPLAGTVSLRARYATAAELREVLLLASGAAVRLTPTRVTLLDAGSLTNAPERGPARCTNDRPGGAIAFDCEDREALEFIASAPGRVLLGSLRTVMRIVRRGDTIGPLREPDGSDHVWRVESIDDRGASLVRSDPGTPARARIEEPSSRPPN